MPSNLSAYEFNNNVDLCSIGPCLNLNEAALINGSPTAESAQLRDGGYAFPPTISILSPAEIEGGDSLIFDSYLSEGSTVSVNLSTTSTCVNVATGFDLFNFGYELLIDEEDIVLEQTSMHYYIDTYTNNTICSASLSSDWVLVNDGNTYNKMLSGTGVDRIPVGTYKNVNSPFDVLTVVYYTPRPDKYTYVGFGGSTGAYTNEHWIHDFRWVSEFNEINMSDLLNNSNLIGDAVVVDSSIRLTDASLNKVGNVFYNLPVYITNNRGQLIDWSAYFVFSTGGGTRGDGLSFIIQPTYTKGGVSGGGVGYGGIPRSIGVIYDTYFNVDEGDLSDNHMQLCVNANVLNPLLNVNLNLNLCGTTGTDEYRYSWIDYSGADKILSVYISDNILKPRSPAFRFFINPRDSGVVAN